MIRQDHHQQRHTVVWRDGHITQSTICMKLNTNLPAFAVLVAYPYMDTQHVNMCSWDGDSYVKQRSKEEVENNNEMRVCVMM